MAGSTRLEGTEFTRENWKPSRKEPAPPACLPQAHYLRCCPPVAPWPVGEGHYLPTNFLMKLTDKTSHRIWNWKTQATSFWSGLTGNGFWKNVNSNKKKKCFVNLTLMEIPGGWEWVGPVRRLLSIRYSPVWMSMVGQVLKDMIVVNFHRHPVQ